MLPYVASLVIGAIFKNGQNSLESLTDILKENLKDTASDVKPDE